MYTYVLICATFVNLFYFYPNFIFTPSMLTYIFRIYMYVN